MNLHLGVCLILLLYIKNNILGILSVFLMTKTRTEYIFFADESGTRELSNLLVNEFCYGGFLTTIRSARHLNKEIAELKRNFFNAEPEIKSNWLRIPRERKKYYLDPYHISENKLRRFCEKLYELFTDQPILCFGAVVSKRRLSEIYKKRIFNPPSVAYEFLLQRIANCAHQLGIPKILLVCDDLSGKTPKRNEWKKLLILQHVRLLQGKSPFYKNWVTRSGMDYRSIDERLVFRDSRISNSLQIADLIVYNIMRQARQSWNNFDHEPLYDWYKIIMPIMHCDPRGSGINRFGAVCFP